MSRVTAWYVERSGNASGPFATDMVLAMLRDGHLKSLDLVYKEGEPEWKPAASFLELRSAQPAVDKRRAEQRQTDQNGTEEQKEKAEQTGVPLVTWIMLRPHGSTYLQEGPFTTQSISEGLRAGRFLYSQYIWRPGLERWARIGDLREFDRRSEMRDELPPMPPPLPDPIEAVLLEDDDDIEAEEFQVFVEANFDLTPVKDIAPSLPSGHLSSASIGGAAAESPERRYHDLAAVPWEQTPVVTLESDDDDEVESFVSTAHVQTAHAETPNPFPKSAAMDKTPLPLISPTATQSTETRVNYKRIVVPLAGAALVGVIGFISFQVLTKATQTHQVQQKQQTSQEVGEDFGQRSGNPAAPMVTDSSVAETASLASAPVALAGAAAQSGQVQAPVSTMTEGIEIAGLHLDRPDGQIVVQGALPAATTPMQLTFKGRLGQVLGSMNVRKTVPLTRKGAELPTVSVSELRLPAGAYTVEFEAGASRARSDIFIGKRDKKFLDQLEMHLREMSAEIQDQKKTLFYSAQELDTLARDLGAQYGKLRGKPKEWTGFFANWQKKYGSTEKRLSGLEKLKADELAYPDETVALVGSMKSLGDTATLFAQGINQGRDIASDVLTEMIAEIVRQRRMIGEVTSRPPQPGQADNSGGDSSGDTGQ